MAEGETAEFEVKDEELVDFEGSDYGFGSDEELEIEEIRKQSTDAGLPSTPASSGRFGQDLASADYSPMATDTSAFDAASEGQQASLKEGAESGEIQEEKEEKEDGAVMQPAMARIASGEGASNGGKRVAESRFKKHRKADLEDGELDDAAVHEGSDREAEGNEDEEDEGSISRQERKRRKDRFAPERQLADVEKNDRREADQAAGSTGKHNRSRGSDRNLERSRNLSKSSAGNLVQAGIMGPGRLLVPADFASQMQLQQLGRGFVGPVGSLYTPVNARPNNFQEALAQEQRFRSQRIIQLAQANAAGPGRPLLSGHLGVPSMHHHPLPALGVQQGLLQWPTQGQEFMQQFNIMAPMDNFGRNSRPYAATGRGVGPVAGMYGIVAGQAGARQMSWSTVPMSNDVQAVGRARAHSRGGQMVSQVWGDAPPAGVVGEAVVGVVNVGQGMGVGHGLIAVGMGSGGQQASGPGPGLGQQGSGQGSVPAVNQNSMVHPPERDSKHSHAQGSGQGGGAVPGAKAGQATPVPVSGVSSSSRMSRASLHSSGSGSSKREASNVDLRPGEGSRNDSEHRSGDDSRRSRRGQNQKLDRKPDSSSRSQQASRHEKDLGRDRHKPAQLSIKSGHQPNGSRVSSLTSNVIQLGVPVHKSRVLTVSGLPDGTSMTAVVEAFEKQGKITDFKKEEKGDTFTITFASLSEAVSAKRHLHRSLMGGRQITVDYSVARA